MKSILREPTRQEKRNAHRRACSAAGMSIEDQEDWGTADPSECEEVFLINEIEGNDNAELPILTTGGRGLHIGLEQRETLQPSESGNPDITSSRRMPFTER